jgi:hypothetical protein
VADSLLAAGVVSAAEESPDGSGARESGEQGESS